MNNEWLYRGIETQAQFIYSSFLSIFLSFSIFHVNIEKSFLKYYSSLKFKT